MKLTYRHTKYAAYIGYISQAIVNNLAPLLFVSFRRDLALSLDKISLLITINFCVQIIVDLLSAKYIDRIGYRRAALLAHIMIVLGLVGLGTLPFLVPPFAGVAVCVVVYAVGGGLTEVIISPIVEALPGDEKESAMSLLHSFYCWGQVAVVLLSTLYFTTIGVQNWHYLPFLWALVPAFNIFMFANVPICTLNEGGGSVPLKKLFCVRVFWLFLLLMVCAGASELAMSQWASLFAEEGLKVSKTFGDLLGPCAFAVLMGTARTVYGIRGSKMNLRRTIFFSALLCVISYMIVVFAPHPVIALAGCALTGLAVGIMWPGTFSLALQYYPQGGTAMFAILALAGDIGCSLGPTLAGFVADHTGDMHDGIFAATAFPVLLVVGILLLRGEKRAVE